VSTRGRCATPRSTLRRLRQLAQLAQEPGIDRVRAWPPLAGAAPERLEQHVEAIGARRLQPLEQVARERAGASSSRERIALANACPKVRPIAIASPDRLHVGERRASTPGELLEGEARPLHDDVVDRRVEGGGRALGDVVGDLVEAVARPRGGRRSSRSESRWPSTQRARARHRAGSSR
jgi:hypothetical protein